MNPGSKSLQPTVSDSAFPVTRWSMVVKACEGSESQAHTALETLCRHYWYPLYAFVRRQGRSHHEAEDCTQEFFARLLAGANLAHARPERGRFRTFLLTSLRNFLINDWIRECAAKRGGRQQMTSLDFRGADDRFIQEPADLNLTPEQAFDRNWALGMVERALAALRAEYRNSERGELFEALGPLLWGNTHAESLAEHASRIGMSVPAFTVALHRLRRRLGDRLRADVADTVANRSEIDFELRHLIAAMGGSVV